MTDFLENTKNLISKLFGISAEDIQEDSFLETDLNITDLEMEDLIAAIEDKYQIQIPPKEWSQFKKVADIVSYLYENVENTL